MTSEFFTSTTDAELNKAIQANKDKKFYVIGMVSPPRYGVKLFAVRMEYEHFIPGTADNDDFDYILRKWEDITWNIVGIPLAKFDEANKVADECGVKLVQATPKIITATGMKAFPVVEELNVYTLESCKDSPVYKNDRTEELLLKEDDMCQSIFNAHEQTTTVQVNKS